MADAVGATGGSVLDRINDSRNRLADSEETFLSLLTVQLKNQDPLSPLDSNQFTQQIVQMTGVEQQLIANDLLSMLVGMSDGGLAGAVGLIGKQVSALSSQTTLQDGEANWTFEVPRTAAKVKLEIVNSLGQTVWSEEKTNLPTGPHEVEWDGKNNDGQAQPEGGKYTLKVTATGTADETIAAQTYVKGVASAVEMIGGETMVTIGKSKVPLSSIIGVQTAA